MIRRSLHSLSSVSEDENDEPMTEAEYRSYARHGFGKQFKELENRCVRGAKINYHLAANHAKWEYRLGMIFAVLGSVTFISILETFGKLFNYNINNIVMTSVTGVFVGLVVCAYDVVVAAVGQVIPIIRVKAKEHVETAAGWQFLELKIRAYKILLRDPQSNVGNYNEWWIGILEERRKLCLTPIPEDVYLKFAKLYPCPQAKEVRKTEQLLVDQNRVQND